MRNVKKIHSAWLAAACLLLVACVGSEAGPQLAGPIMEARVSSGPTVLSGTVVNDGPVPATVVTVTFVMRNRNGAQQSVTAMVKDGETLSPGETAEFSVLFDGDADHIDYSIGYNDQPGSLYILR